MSTSPTPSSAFPEQLAPTDAILWMIERDPLLRTTVVAVSLLDREIDPAELRQRVITAMDSVPRLRQRIEASPAWSPTPPSWREVADIDLDYHLRRLRLPAPADLRSVLDFAQVLGTEPFDRGRPLWEFVLVEGLEGGRSALVQKLHHAMADGVAAVRLALALYDAGPGPGPAGEAPTRAMPSRAFGHHSLFDRARSVVRVLGPTPSPLSPLLRSRGLGWRFDTLDVPVAGLRDAGHAASGTLNDAFLTAVVRGLALYHRRRGSTAKRLRINMPVSFRRATDPPGGNAFAPIRFPVPGDVERPLEHLLRIARITADRRDEPALPLSRVLAGGLARLPAGVTTALFGGMLRGVDAVVTDVPGFPGPISLVGATVERMYAFAPPAGAAVNVALLSMQDTACIGALSVAAALPDAPLFAECLGEGFADVLSVVGRADQVVAGAVRPAA